MKTAEKRQRAKVGGAGSFFNQLMSNNSSIPVVGKGATEMHYSDRTCYEVIEVSEDGKTVKLERLEASWDKTQEGGIGHQNWILTPIGAFITVVWRNNCWKTKTEVIDFTKEFLASCGDNYVGRVLTTEQMETIFNGNQHPQVVVEGITEKKTVYHKIRILFGSKDYYYDWSF